MSIVNNINSGIDTHAEYILSRWTYLFFLFLQLRKQAKIISNFFILSNSCKKNFLLTKHQLDTIPILTEMLNTIKLFGNFFFFSLNYDKYERMFFASVNFLIGSNFKLAKIKFNSVASFLVKKKEKL